MPAVALASCFFCSGLPWREITMRDAQILAVVDSAPGPYD